MSATDERGDIVIRRVYVNKGGYVALDSDIFGKRRRLSTGKKADDRTLRWYRKNFDREYEALYFTRIGEKKDVVTFREYGNMVIDFTACNRTPETQREAKAKFNRLCEFFGDMAIDCIKATDIMRWQSSCRYAPKTVVNYRSYLNMILRAAYNDGLIERNPIDLVRPPRMKRVKEPIYYSAEEMMKIISCADGHIKNAIQVAAFTGLRGGELIALKWSDIDFERMVIHVRRSIRDGREKSTKSEKPRIVPIVKPTMEALKRQRLESGLTDRVFLTQHRKPYRSPEKITEAMKRACEKASLPIGTLHDLRRSFNTLLKQYGYPEDFILDIIGNVKDVNRNHYTGRIEVDLSKFDQFVC